MPQVVTIVASVETFIQFWDQISDLFSLFPFCSAMRENTEVQWPSTTADKRIYCGSGCHGGWGTGAELTYISVNQSREIR